MEVNPQPKRKSTKLRTLFLKYLAAFCGGTIGLVLVLGSVFFGLMAAGSIVPANYAEKQVVKAESEIMEGREPPFDASSTLYKYAKFTVDGKLREHNLSKKQGLFVWNLLEDSESSYRYPYYYTKITNKQEVYIFRHSISAQFTSPALRRLLPNAELFFIILLGIAFLGGSAVLASSFGRKLSRKMSGLEDAARRIQEQDLNISIQYSGITEIDRVLLSMDQMKNALRNSLERQWSLEQSRREQISALAHDVKTPLTIIRGNVELLGDTDMNDEQKEYSGYVAESTRQMETYINTLIEITKTESANSLHPVSTDTEAFIRRIEGQMQALSVMKGLSPAVTARILPNWIYVDPVLLERALMNVISNAVDQTPNGRSITLTAELVKDSIRFCVLDEGPGFSPESLQFAAEQFYMGDSSRGATGHYGMGLYITRFIARLHDGELYIANSLQTGGGEVTIEIPLKPSAATPIVN
ncbi:HAMP domain-containing sensor histidine kinase [Bacillus infantis]|uniref:HAMP domain-containing sensor histidine kinase n=1 Tax=Bacillus infantis TaxID=324767 RepID=UPI003CF73F5A